MVCQAAWSGAGPCVGAAAMPPSRFGGENIGPLGENCTSMPDILLRSKLGEEPPERAQSASSSLGQHSEPSGDPVGAVGRGRSLPRRGRRPPSPGSSTASSDESELRGQVHSYLPSWVRSRSDGVLHAYVQKGRSGSNERVLMPPCRGCASMPAVLAPRPRGPPPESRQGPPRNISLSQARLIIPRSISEYFECCRFARPHSEGLLWVATTPSGVLATCRDMVPRALSEGLLGGRFFASTPQGRPGPPPGEERPPPKPRIPVSKLKEGMALEGRIVRTVAFGLFVDVGATRQGLLRWRDCRGVPRQLLRRDEVLSNLTVTHVWPKKRRFALSVAGVGADDENLEEENYGEILRRIAGWAGVTLPVEGEGAAASAPEGTQAAASGSSSSASRGPAGTKAKGRGKGGRYRWAVKTAASAAPEPAVVEEKEEEEEEEEEAASPRRSPRRRGRRRPAAAAAGAPPEAPPCEAGGGGLHCAGPARALRGGGRMGRMGRRRKPASD